MSKADETESKETLAAIRDELKQARIESDTRALEQFLEDHEADIRTGVQKMNQQARKSIDRWLAEDERIQKLSFFEQKYGKDYNLIAGIDEVGRGPLAGPVMTCAVILPRDCRIHGINDSKKLSEKQREELYPVLKREAVAYGIGAVSPERIDAINILEATYEAMRMAVSKLSPQPDLLLVDAVHIPDLTVPEVSIIKGDAKSISIGAASILAKVTRDHYMEEMDAKYPEYHFRENKGYGTREHIEALKKYGPCPIHRKTFITHFIETA